MAPTLPIPLILVHIVEQPVLLEAQLLPERPERVEHERVGGRGGGEEGLRERRRGGVPREDAPVRGLEVHEEAGDEDRGEAVRGSVG